MRRSISIPAIWRIAAGRPDFTFTVPDTLRSGSYVLHLTCDAGEDWLPFYVRPHAKGPHARIAFLASTFTYQAYANFARGNTDAAYRARVAEWSAYPHNPDHYPIYGRSTYNMHEDGAGVCFSSRRRPILTMRPGFMTFNDPRGSGTRHYIADFHLLAWLEDKGFAFDIVTDEDLDDEGVAALAPYRALLTGSHPEYHTERTLDALTHYKQRGGRIAYLGGNGFYWRIARSPTLPHVIEMRRAEGGVRSWAAEPGEYFNMLDGALGGMWRRGQAAAATTGRRRVHGAGILSRRPIIAAPKPRAIRNTLDLRWGSTEISSATTGSRPAAPPASSSIARIARLVRPTTRSSLRARRIHRLR